MRCHQTQDETRQDLARLLPRAFCPRCGEAMFMAQASEFMEDGEIRHHWSCDACGEDFLTTVNVAQERPERPAP
jgi:ribosomal protein S27AE